MLPCGYRLPGRITGVPDIEYGLFVSVLGSPNLPCTLLGHPLLGLIQFAVAERANQPWHCDSNRRPLMRRKHACQSRTVDFKTLGVFA